MNTYCATVRFVLNLHFKLWVEEQKGYLQQPWNWADQCRIQANLLLPCFLPGPKEKEKKKKVIYHQMYIHNSHKHIWLPEPLDDGPHKPLEDTEIQDICLLTLALNHQTVPLIRVVFPIQFPQRALKSGLGVTKGTFSEPAFKESWHGNLAAHGMILFSFRGAITLGRALCLLQGQRISRSCVALRVVLRHYTSGWSPQKRKSCL